MTHISSSSSSSIVVVKVMFAHSYSLTTVTSVLKKSRMLW